MSRTDVHMPWWVKERDPGWAEYFAEHHDHRQGPCDLDKWLPKEPRWVRTRCSRTMLWRGHNIGCGCHMCTGQIYRRIERRRDRHNAKRALLRLGRANPPYAQEMDDDGTEDLAWIPAACPGGHQLGPGQVNLSWVHCDCTPGATGHHIAFCRVITCHQPAYPPGHVGPVRPQR